MKLKDLKALTSAANDKNFLGDQLAVNAFLREQGLEPGKFYQELEMTSRYVDTHQDISYSNASVSLHSHNFYEILFCCNTCGAEYLVGAERYRLQRGDIVVVPPGISHCPLLPAEMDSPYKRYVLWLSTEYVNQLIQQFPDELLIQIPEMRLLRTEGTKWEYLGAMFRRGVEEAERQKPGWEMMVASNALQLIVHIRRAALERSAAVPIAEKPELLDQILAYIEENLEKKITLSDVAKQFWVSQSTVTQTFRNKIGVSFYRCVTQKRLIAAKSMIIEDIPLEQIGERVGFRDYSTFYRAFKQEYGISPRQYRKIQEGSEQEAVGRNLL